MAVGVLGHRALSPDTQGLHALDHEPLTAGIHRGMLVQPPGSPVQHLGQLPILGAHRRPALPHPAVIPPPSQQAAQLPVGRP